MSYAYIEKREQAPYQLEALVRPYPQARGAQKFLRMRKDGRKICNSKNTKELVLNFL
jgi:hypothetical protein